MTRRLALLAFAACSSKSMDAERAAELFTRVTLDTAPGLSGLAVDDDGALWTVSERDAKAYIITLDAAQKPKLQMFKIEGIPEGSDLEAIGWLGKGRLAFGTEGRQDGVATVLLADERGDRILITRTIKLPEERIGLKIKANHGVEGICGAANTIVAAIEEVGEVDGKRWAPIVTIDDGAITGVHKLWLTTKTGKISSLDCQRSADNRIHALAIERHFEVTRLLSFVLPASADGDITPTVALDLDTVLNGKLNLEGVAWLSDGTVVAVVDNQYGKISGPSELLVFKPGTVKP
jgi:hypothetical protein